MCSKVKTLDGHLDTLMNGQIMPVSKTFKKVSSKALKDAFIYLLSSPYSNHLLKNQLHRDKYFILNFYEIYQLKNEFRKQ